MEPQFVCLPEHLLRLQGTSAENVFYTTVFPPLCAVGIVGNCLSLTVLLSNESRNRRFANPRSNSLLVALAMCDILFLLFMVPHSLANFDYFAMNYTFRSLYLPAKQHLVSLANWCSAAATWLVIAICLERTLGIRALLRPKSDNSTCTTAHAIAFIVVVSGALTFYNNFSHHCVVKELCHGSQIISKCFDVVQDAWPGNTTNFTPHAIRVYVRWSIIANVIFVIVFPILLMIALNVALVIVIRRQSFLMYSRLLSESEKKQQNACEHAADLNACVTQNMFRRSIDQTMQFQAEHRVTVTVCFIVTCFTITQGPSAIVLSINFFSDHKPPFVNSNVIWYHANLVVSGLVVLGKTLNFALFCLSSATFRSRLTTILKKKLLLLSRRRSLLNSSAVCVPSNCSSLKKAPMSGADRRASLASQQY
ncbi:Protein W10C4.1 [Aphelenchoides avenae]|nr:Protein W10C4.1 [Aphelenchus avenae]